MKRHAANYKKGCERLGSRCVDLLCDGILGVLTLCVFVFVCAWFVFESRRQPLRLVEVWDSLVLNQLRVFTGSLKEDSVFHRRSARYLRDFGSR